MGNIPHLIKTLRKRLSLTQEQFAQRVGVSFSTVNSWENGRRIPSPVCMNQIQRIMEETELREKGTAKIKPDSQDSLDQSPGLPAGKAGATLMLNHRPASGGKKTLWLGIKDRFFTPRWILSGVVTIIVVIGFVIYLSFIPVLPSHYLLEGTLYVETGGVLKVLRGDDSLPLGQMLKTKEAQSAQIKLRDGSLVKVLPNTSITLGDDPQFKDRLLSLEAGELHCQIVKGRGKFRVLVPGGVVDVLGTEFVVRVLVNRKEIKTLRHKSLSFITSATVHIAVSSGIVLLAINEPAGSREQKIKAGEQVVQELSPPPPVELEEEIKNLITALEDEKRETREKAMEVLAQIGYLSISYLGEVSSFRDPEIRSRIKRLMDRYNPPPLQWSSQIAPYGLGLRAPVVSDDQLYLTSSHGPILYAIDKYSGVINWELRQDGFNSAPLLEDGIIYIGTLGGSFFALESQKGKIIWQKTGLGAVQSTPTMHNNILYIGAGEPGTNRGKFYALDAHTGGIKWAFATSGIIADCQAAIYAKRSPAAPDRGLSFGATTGIPPVPKRNGSGSGRGGWWEGAGNDLVFFGAWDGKLYALNAQTGKKVWDYQTNEQIVTSPIVADGLVYIGSGNGRLYALSVRDGQKQWSFQADSAIIESPIKVGQAIYWGTKHKIYAFDLNTRTIIWSYHRERSTMGTIAVVEGKVYLGTDGGRLIALNATSGEKEWDFEIPRQAVLEHCIYYEIVSAPAILNDRLYITSRPVGTYAMDNHVYAFKLK